MVSPAETIRADRPLSKEEYIAYTSFPELPRREALERMETIAYGRMLEEAMRLDQIGRGHSTRSSDLRLIRNYFRAYDSWTRFIRAIREES